MRPFFETNRWPVILSISSIAWIIPLVISLWGAATVVGDSPRAIRRYCPSTSPSSDTLVTTVPQSATRMAFAASGSYLPGGPCVSLREKSVCICLPLSGDQFNLQRGCHTAPFYLEKKSRIESKKPFFLFSGANAWL